MPSSSRRRGKRNETGRHEQEGEGYACKHVATKHVAFSQKQPLLSSQNEKLISVKASRDEFIIACPASSSACGSDPAPSILESFWNFGTNESVTLRLAVVALSTHSFHRPVLICTNHARKLDKAGNRISKSADWKLHQDLKSTMKKKLL